MFRYESEMIPVLVESLSKTFNTKYITTEFGTGNGIADLVFTTQMSQESLFFDDYSLMALFVTLFQQDRVLTTKYLKEANCDKIRLRRLLSHLECSDFIAIDGDRIIQNRKYRGHTQNLFSVEAKLLDWKSGLYQALRYKFFSHKSYLAYPGKYIHRVNLDLLKEHNVGLIAVYERSIRFVLKPKTEKPLDVTSYYFLSEIFAREIQRKLSPIEVNSNIKSASIL